MPRLLASTFRLSPTTVVPLALSTRLFLAVSSSICDMEQPGEAMAEEDDFNLSEDLVPAPKYTQAQTRTVYFKGFLEPGLSLHTDLSKGNGGTTWPAGEALAKYLLRRKRDELRTSTMCVCTST